MGSFQIRGNIVYIADIIGIQRLRENVRHRRRGVLDPGDNLIQVHVKPRLRQIESTDALAIGSVTDNAIRRIDLLAPRQIFWGGRGGVRVIESEHYDRGSPVGAKHAFGYVAGC